MCKGSSTLTTGHGLRIRNEQELNRVGALDRFILKRMITTNKLSVIAFSIPKAAGLQLLLLLVPPFLVSKPDLKGLYRLPGGRD